MHPEQLWEIEKLAPYDEVRWSGDDGSYDALTNLLANGMDAIRDKGTLHVHISRLSLLERSEPLIQLTMADNGSGIAPENLKRLFEPFFTTKEAVGTGLGLWITQELVRRHNGSIRVRSRKDKGTVFRITIPAMRTTTATEHERRGEERSLRRSSPRRTKGVLPGGEPGLAALHARLTSDLTSTV